jgi:hypothetical protein
MPSNRDHSKTPRQIEREQRAAAALITARSSSAVEGIRKPFEGKRVRDAASGIYAPAVFPGSKSQR